MSRALAALMVVAAAACDAGAHDVLARRAREVERTARADAAAPSRRASDAPPPADQDVRCAAMTAVVTPPRGPAWLDHLRTPIDATWLGHVGDGAARPPRRGVERGPCVRLTGADIYRYTCRACHGPKGEGAPPEIPSVVGPVRATSTALVRERLGGAGAQADLVTALTSEATTSLRRRIRQGGERMPGQDQLTPEEEAALVQELDAMAGVPASERGPERRVLVSEARVGELVVKGTCRICHGANVWHGPRPEDVGFEPSAPPFAVFPLLEPDRIVGAVLAGDNGWLGPERRMPAFGYLTREEAEAVVRYLHEHAPPRED